MRRRTGDRQNPAEKYSVLAKYYDRLNSEVDYSAIAAYCDWAYQKYGVPGKNKLALDLGCGTGTLTLKLAAMGYDMIGVDGSAEMLAQACAKPTPWGAEMCAPILWLNQDMCSLELYGTVGMAVCSLDGINYLTDACSLRRCFSLVHNYLDPGGIFIFDVNTRYKFENIYGCRDYILESDGVLCAWRNHYSKRTRLCRFNLTLFSEKNGVWIRRDEAQTERMWPDKTLRRELKSAGFALLDMTAGYTGQPSSPTDERHTYIVRAVKLVKLQNKIR